ncbi:MAG: ATP-binding protein, partial [Mariniphaga sp.]|nr:ATP-binding protein [Mariniphaga sp.]
MITTTSTNFQFYQSANISDCNIIKQNFVVRTKEFELIRSDLFDDKMIESVQHYLILGRRGSGKSTLLRRIECEIETDEQLKQKYFVINFAEEQGSIHRLFDLFEEVIKVLKSAGFENLPETDLMDIPDDYAEYSRKLFGYIQAALHTKSKKLILLIDNIDKIFLGLKNDAQIFREILLNFDDVKIIGGSTKMSEHFWQYDLPFYQFFRIIKLEALSSSEIKNLLLSWAEIYGLIGIETFVKTKPGQIEAIRILTDGLPRTIQFFIDLLINRPQPNGYSYIQKIMDLITPLYQERLNLLTAIEQKIVMKLAFYWEAVSIKELVKPTKIESKLLSANLKKLSDIGI